MRLGTLGVFVVMMAVFVAANPAVFTTWSIYSSVLTTLPVALFVVVPLVFVVTVGEIDLLSCHDGFLVVDIRAPGAGRPRPLPRYGGRDPDRLSTRLLRRRTRCLCRAVVADRHTWHEFLLRGLIQIFNEGKSKALVTLDQSWAYKIFSSQVFGVPVQIFWAIAFVIFAALLYNRHRFGVQVKIVGDNPDSADQMGINVKRVRMKTFVFMGIGAAIGGTFSTMINFVVAYGR